MHEISTLAFFGRPATATVSRAGNGLPKVWPYSSFTVAKKSILVKKMVVFSTKSGWLLLASKTAAKFFNTWAVSASKESFTIWPVNGSKATWPLTNTKPFSAMAWLYGPIAAGAEVVEISCFMIFRTLFLSVKSGSATKEHKYLAFHKIDGLVLRLLPKENLVSQSKFNSHYE